jgi:hypothetical protein
MLALLPSFAVHAHATTPSSNHGPAVAVMSDRFETIIYTKADFLSQYPEPYGGVSEGESNLMRMPFARLLPDEGRGEGTLPARAASDLLANAEAVLVGAKHFRPPAARGTGPYETGLGAVNSQLCYVILLRPRSSFQLRDHLTSDVTGSASGTPVWQRVAPPSEGHPEPHTFYAAQISSHHVLICNNLSDLQIVARDLTTSDRRRPDPSKPAGHCTVSADSEYWGCRKYASYSVPSLAAPPGVDTAALTVDFRQKTGTFRFQGRSVGQEALGMTGTHMERLGAPFRRANGAWETKFSLSGDEQSLERLFGLLALLGFAVFL